MVLQISMTQPLTPLPPKYEIHCVCMRPAHEMYLQDAHAMEIVNVHFIYMNMCLQFPLHTRMT